ncbi:MAG TPA: SurA N-terminal domain-containing protein [Nocardioidaceae bacterium]
MRKNWLLGLLLALLLVGASACGGADGDGGDGSSGSEAAQEQPEKGSESATPEPEVDDVPEVVAEVNGEEISRADFVEAYEAQFQQAAMQAGASGQPVDQDKLKEQVAESMVTTRLLVQEAERRDIQVSDKDVEKTLKQLAAQNGAGTVDDLVAALEQQGMDRDQVDAEVRNQVRIERLVEDEAGGLSVSDKEVRAFYDQLVAQQEQAAQQGGGQEGEQEIPPLAQIRPQLEEQVKSQKESQVAQRLVGELREDADVVINL